MSQWTGTSEGELESNLYSFSQGAVAQGAAVGLSPAQIAAATAAYTDFVTNRQAWQVAQDAAHAATQAKAEAKASSVAVLRQLTAIVRASPAASDDVLAGFGLPVYDKKPTRSAPNVPTDLSAFGRSDGTNLLKWNRNRNKKETRYFIEARFHHNSEWELIDVVTATKYVHEGVIPGQPVYYRVIAKRNIQRSAPSNTAIVYGGMEALELRTTREAA